MTLMSEPGSTSSAIATATSASLKEWAVVCNSLLEGEQIITIRKGGIREDGRHFSVPHDRFFLFPTYEHQAHELVKPAYRSSIDRTMVNAVHGELAIPGWCEVTDIFRITTPEELDALDSKHIWTSAYVTERLKWKKRDPLWILVLRTYRLDDPLRIPLLDSYGGCKSWVDLEARLDFNGEVALSETAFGAKRQGIRDALAGLGVDTE